MGRGALGNGVVEHLRFQLGQRRSGIDPQLLNEEVPRLAAGVQRLVLLAGEVVRGGESNPASLVQRMLATIACAVCSAAVGSPAPQVVPRRGRPSPRPALSSSGGRAASVNACSVDAVEGPATPQIAGCGQRLGSAVRVARSQHGAAGRDQTVELARVDQDGAVKA